MRNKTRRRFLTSTVSIGIAASLAGCSDSNNSTENEEDTTPQNTDDDASSGETNGNGESGSTDSSNESEDSESESEAPQEEAVAWLEENHAKGFDGELVDRTGEDEITIIAGGDDGFTYDPPGVIIDQGTTVNWTGAEDPENSVPAVVPEERDNEQGFETLNPDPGETESHTFEQPGVFRYLDTTLRAQGTFGAIVIE